MTRVRGAFQLLTTNELASAREALARASIAPEPERSLALADQLLALRLYDDLMLHVSAAEEGPHNGGTLFVLHQRMAGAYREMVSRLALLQIGHPESIWAAAMVRQSLEASYRTLGAEPQTEE